MTSRLIKRKRKNGGDPLMATVGTSKRTSPCALPPINEVLVEEAPKENDTDDNKTETTKTRVPKMPYQTAEYWNQKLGSINRKIAGCENTSEKEDLYTHLFNTARGLLNIITLQEHLLHKMVLEESDKQDMLKKLKEFKAVLDTGLADFQ